MKLPELSSYLLTTEIIKILLAIYSSHLPIEDPQPPNLQTVPVTCCLLILKYNNPKTKYLTPGPAI